MAVGSLLRAAVTAAAATDALRKKKFFLGCRQLEQKGFVVYENPGEITGEEKFFSVLQEKRVFSDIWAIALSKC